MPDRAPRFTRPIRAPPPFPVSFSMPNEAAELIDDRREGVILINENRRRLYLVLLAAVLRHNDDYIATWPRANWTVGRRQTYFGGQGKKTTFRHDVQRSVKSVAVLFSTTQAMTGRKLSTWEEPLSQAQKL